MPLPGFFPHLHIPNISTFNNKAYRRFNGMKSTIPCGTRIHVQKIAFLIELNTQDVAVPTNKQIDRKTLNQGFGLNIVLSRNAPNVGYQHVNPFNVEVQVVRIAQPHP